MLIFSRHFVAKQGLKLRSNICAAALMAGLTSMAVTQMPNAAAQTVPFGSIVEESLGSAQAYDTGLLDFGQGGLDPTLWSGTSALTATEIIDAVPANSVSPATRGLISAALLSGGTPPEGGHSGGPDQETYLAARLGKLSEMKMGAQAEQLLASQPQLAASAAGQHIKVNNALSSGQIEDACFTADTIEDARAEPFWAKLRSFCHVTRGEIAAAELTADLLERSGHEDAAFYSALRQLTGLGDSEAINAGGNPLLLAMLSYAQHSEGSGANTQDPLSAFIADAADLDPQAFSDRLTALATVNAPSEEENPGGFFDFEQTLADPSASAWGKLYGIVKTGTDAGVGARVAAELLERAEDAGIFEVMARNLAPDLAIIPPSIGAQYNPAIFVKMAVLDGDLNALRTIYDSIDPDDPLKERTALASDALGNGFVLGTLGAQMTARLTESLAGSADQRRAIRDVFIAVGLGARLSDDAAHVLSNYNGRLTGRAANPGALLVLRAAATRGSKAETALRAAAILGEGGPQSLRADDLSSVLTALSAAGLQDYAGRLAAEDYLQ